MQIIRVFLLILISFALSLSVAAAKEFPSEEDTHSNYHNEMMVNADHHGSDDNSKTKVHHAADAKKSQGSHCNTCTSAVPLAADITMIAPLRSVQNAATLHALLSLNTPPPLRPPFFRA
ncbi:hypothetical protein [Chitinibacter tainanensis]|uniref:hypothetical protein n=1 Tax=Chitinibacter tainanensis TaxID=230667 RepID=UPI0023521D73|nr:hypothetical protein [Chitinibacter tainanensis]